MYLYVYTVNHEVGYKNTAQLEVAIAILRLKCNKASGYDGLPAELFKARDELVSCMHHLLCNIWSLASMPSDWSLSTQKGRCHNLQPLLWHKPTHDCI